MNEIRDYNKPTDAMQKTWQVFLKLVASAVIVVLCGLTLSE